jgi:rod shape-determining protein MreC
MQRERRIANYLFLLYAGASMTFLSLSFTGPILSLRAVLGYLWMPAPEAGASGFERAAGVPAGVAHLLDADAENRRLRDQLKQFSWLEAQLATLRRENERLKGELGLKPARGRALRWARVLEREPANWYRSITIESGEKDGVGLNSPVLGVEKGRLGVVGRVTELGPHWSKVLLITDELSAVAAYIPGKQWEGLVEGQGKSTLLMNYLPMEGAFAIGDQVHTSATSQTFPQDIPIGTVIRVFPEDPFLTTRSVAVEPAVHAATLKEVLVLTPLQEVQAPAS